MSDTNIKTIVFGVILSSLFIFLLVGGLLGLATDNDSIDSFNSPEILAFKNTLNTSLQANAENNSRAYNAFSNSSISLTGSLPFFDSIGGIWQTLVSTPKLLISASFEFIKATIANGDITSIVLKTLMGLFLIGIIIAIVAWIATGRP